MSGPVVDQWARWLLHGRHGDDPQRRRVILEDLYPVRDHVLEQARLRRGDVLLDVGAGEGLIGFGALERVGAQGKVIFGDISQALLDRCREAAGAMDVLDRCAFVRAAAEDLAPVADGSVDAVTTRSVLMYVGEKQRAFSEFRRVLRPAGRLSIFEPIGRFGMEPEPPDPHTVGGYDVRPVAEIAAKLRAYYEARSPIGQPPGENPALNFDERDLIAFAERAGFGEIHLEFRASVRPFKPPRRWDLFLRATPSPLVPSLETAMEEALTPGEAERLAAHVRPLVEAGQTTRKWQRSAEAYLAALRA